jgi:hypothetical protein
LLPGSSLYFDAAARLIAMIRGTSTIDSMVVRRPDIHHLYLLQIDFLDLRSTPYWLQSSWLAKLLSPEILHLPIVEAVVKTIAKAVLSGRPISDAK